MTWMKERLIPLAIIILLSFGLGSVGYVEKQNDQPSYAQNETTESRTDGSASQPSVVIIPPVIEAPRTPQDQRAEDWQTRDHKAQVGMLWVSVAAIILTTIGVILVGFTLLYTRDAARSASKTLKVANETLAESKKVSFDSLRAYLGITQVSFGRETDNSLTFVVKVKNFGSTPATKVFVGVDAGFMTGQRAWKPLKAGSLSDITIMPDQEIDLHCHGISLQNFGEAAPEGVSGFDEVEIEGILGFQTFGRTFSIKFIAMNSGLRGDMFQHPKGVVILHDLMTEGETVAEYD